jgi:hypothetical protein
MPNWVYANLKISSESREILENYIEKFKSDKSLLTFQSILARPPDKEADWYDWNITNWGTKWDACDVEFRDLGRDIYYSYSTAWSPAWPVIEALAQDHNLRIVHHFEEEQGWGGQAIYEEGKLVENKSWDIPSTHEEAIKRANNFCGCESADEQYYPDCFYARAKDIEGLTEKHLEYIKGLAPTWSEGFESLVATSKKL